MEEIQADFDNDTMARCEWHHKAMKHGNCLLVITGGWDVSERTAPQEDTTVVTLFLSASAERKKNLMTNHKWADLIGVKW